MPNSHKILLSTTTFLCWLGKYCFFIPTIFSKS